MATSQSTSVSTPEPDPESQLATIREQFSVTCRIVNPPNYPQHAVTETGRVFSWAKTTRHRLGKIRELAQSAHETGYRYVRFQYQGKYRYFTVHRLVAELFLPPPREGQTLVRHLNGDPADNRAENLAWGTQKENMADCIRHGRTLKGRKNPNAKLNDNLVRVIKILLAEDFSPSAIASFLGISTPSVTLAASGKQWGHVEEPQ